MNIAEYEVMRLAHLAAHECAILAAKAHVAAKGRYADSESIKAAYKETHDALFAFIEKKLKDD